MIFINAENNNNKLYRYPADVIKHIAKTEKTKGKIRAKHSTGIEVRFRTKDESFKVNFKSTASGNMFVYVGNMSYKSYAVKKGKNEITIEIHERYLKYNPKKDLHYPADLIRIIFTNQYLVSDFNLNCNELEYVENNKSILCYGSSFTEGLNAFAYPYSYAFTLGELLKLNVVNKALSGSCLIEKEVVDYLATVDVDYYLLELGCNVRGFIDEKEFRKRVAYLFKTLKETNRPIFVINSLEFFKKQFSEYKDSDPYYKKNITFTKIVREEAKKVDAFVISMNKLMQEYNAVSADMLHPGALGQIKIAFNLASILKKKI